MRNIAILHWLFAGLVFLSSVCGSLSADDQTLLLRRDQLSDFCNRFNKACLDASLKDQRGVQKIEFFCTADKSSSTAADTRFRFTCKSNGKDYTGTALANIQAEVAPRTSTTTAGAQTQTASVRTTVSSGTTTVTSIVRVQPTTVAGTTTLNQGTTQTTDVATGTTTKTVTTEVVTVPHAGTTSTTVDVTSNLYTTSTALNIVLQGRDTPEQNGDIQVEVRDTWEPLALGRRGSDNDPTRFCGSFASSCTRECKRIEANVRQQKCRKNPALTQSTGKYIYDLNCYCANGISETRHALAEINNDDSVTIVTVTGQATTTRLSTVVVPQQTNTVTTTSTGSNTASVTATSTISSDTTLTRSGVSTAFVTATSTFDTTTFGTTVTVTSVVATETVSTSTLFVVAPTGKVQVRRRPDDSILGYVGLKSAYSDVLKGALDKSSALTMMLVKDSVQDLYAMSFYSDRLSKVVYTNFVYGGVYQGYKMGTPVGTGQAFQRAFWSYDFRGTLATVPADQNPAYTNQYNQAVYENFVFKLSPTLVDGQPSVNVTCRWRDTDGAVLDPVYILSRYVSGGDDNSIEFTVSSYDSAESKRQQVSNGGSYTPVNLIFDTTP